MQGLVETCIMQQEQTRCAEERVRSKEKSKRYKTSSIWPDTTKGH